MLFLTLPVCLGFLLAEEEVTPQCAEHRANLPLRPPRRRPDVCAHIAPLSLQVPTARFYAVALRCCSVVPALPGVSLPVSGG